MPAFSRLIRFLDPSGHAHYGSPLLPPHTTDLSLATHAHIIDGDIFTPAHHLAPTPTPVHALLPPLSPHDTRSVRCLGLNYARHARESNLPLPTYPVLFFKPPTALSGPRSPIPIPFPAQECPGLDYEAELVVVIGRRCKDVEEADALDYVFGYAVGNDVSHREWQLKRGGGQWALGKGFDGWAPWGPGIVTREVLEEEGGLGIRCVVNGEVRQESSTRDMVFGVARTVAVLSRGTTLVPGDLIFMGTPEGVGMGRKPPAWLQDGDVVEVSLEGVGRCVNKVEFEKSRAKL